MSSSFTSGSVLIPNEVTASQSGILNSNTGALITGTFPIVRSSEKGTMFPDGTFVYGTSNLTAITNAVVYNAAGTLLSTLTPFSATGWSLFSPFTSDFSSTLYVSKVKFTTATQVAAFSVSGVAGGTWTLDDLDGVVGLAVSADNRTLYATMNQSGLTPVLVSYDLTSGATPTRTVLASLAMTGTWNSELLLVPGTQTLLVMVSPDSAAHPTPYETRLYSTSGTLLKTFPAVNDAADYSQPHLSLDLGATSIAFWTRTFADLTGATSAFEQILLSSGVVAQSFTVPNDSTDPTKAPLSCPFFAWSNNLQTPAFVGTRQTVPIRRVRRTPQMTSELFFQFMSRFEIMFQPGAGIPSDLTTPPKFMIRWSKDGGNTWSQEVQMSAGMTGAYWSRVFVTRGPRARNVVFEVSTSDAALWVLVDAFIQSELGSS